MSSGWSLAPSILWVAPRTVRGHTWQDMQPTSAQLWVQPHRLYLKGCSRVSLRPWVWGSREEEEAECDGMVSSVARPGSLTLLQV